MTSAGPLVVAVDLLDPTPPYEQLRRQVTAHVAAGALEPGQRLPTVRELAGRLGLATNTVARAYRELEADGLVTTRRRVGTVVTAAARQRQADGGPVAAAADALVVAARAAGLDEAAALTEVRAAFLRARPPVASPP